MKSNLLTLWEKVEFFYIEENNIRFNKDQINNIIDLLIKNLLKIDDLWENKIIYIDIKNRKLFILLFISLLKLKSKIVLVPNEIKSEDYYFKGGIFISDNKQFNECIFLNEDLTFKIENNYNHDIEISNINENAVLFLYTSGSTGKAKLIPKTDENLFVELKELSEIFKVEKNNTFYFTPPIYHIYGLLFALLLPLYTDSGLIIDFHFTPESIAKFINEKKVDYFISIPSYYNMFVNLNLLDNFRNCKYFVSSSAPLSIETSKEFYKNNYLIVEIYGSTETGGIAHRISAQNEVWKLYSYVNILKNKQEPIKENYENKDFYELLINSPAISVLYDNEIGYNTNDIVEIHDTNKFSLVGRNTRFIKINGKRVDLKYISEKIKIYLLNFNFNKINDENLYIGEKNGKIYVIFEDKFPRNNSMMKNELKGHLPGYAVPRMFLSMKIPRNSMGKINKKEIDRIIDEYTNK